MIKLKEEIDIKDTKWRTTFRSMEDQLSDLRFSLETKEREIAKQKTENGNQKVKIDTLLAKLYLPSKNIKLDELPVELRDNLLKEPYNKIPKSINGEQLEEQTQKLSADVKELREEEEKKWIDSLKNADRKVKDLTSENKDLKVELENSMNMKHHYEKQILSREQEMHRLKNELDRNGVELTGLKADYQKKTYEEKIERQTLQNDYLNKELHKCEDEILLDLKMGDGENIVII